MSRLACAGRPFQVIGLASMLLAACTATALAGHLLGVRFGRHDDRIRVVLDLDAPTSVTQAISSDGRVVTIGLAETSVQGAMASGAGVKGGHPVAGVAPLIGFQVNVGQPATATDVQLTASRPVEVLAVKTMPPGGDSKQHRVVIDVRGLATLAASPSPSASVPPAVFAANEPPVRRLEIPDEARPESFAPVTAQSHSATTGRAPVVPAEAARIEAMLAAARAAAEAVPSNTAEAIALYRQAADAGSPVGAFALGQIYRLGVGVDENDALAAFWYGEAARAGYPPAEMNLGIMQLRGVGLNPDPAAGLAMIQRAASHGNQPARALLDRIAHAGLKTEFHP